MAKPFLKIDTATFYFKNEEQKQRFARRYFVDGKWLIGLATHSSGKVYINGIEYTRPDG